MVVSPSLYLCFLDWRGTDGACCWWCEVYGKGWYWPVYPLLLLVLILTVEEEEDPDPFVSP